MKTIMAIFLLIFFTLSSAAFGQTVSSDLQEEEIMRTLEQIAKSEAKKRDEKPASDEAWKEAKDAPSDNHTSSL